MDTNLKSSRAEDLALLVWCTVPLPVPQTADGSPFRMRLGVPPLERILKFFQGPPLLGSDEAEPEVDPAEKPSASELLNRVATQTLETSAELEKQARALFGELGAQSEPPISFDGPRAGAVLWAQLHFRNRLFIVREVARLAGAGPSRLDGLGSFRPEPAGRDVRPPGDGAVPAAEVAP